MKELRLTSFVLSDACNEVEANLGWLQSGLPVISISGNFWSNMSNAGRSSRVNLGFHLTEFQLKMLIHIPIYRNINLMKLYDK